MKNILKPLFLSVFLSALLFSCNEDDESLDISEVKFKNNTLELVESMSYNLSDYLDVVGTDASQAKITLTSDDTDIISVDGTTFSAQKVGSTKLTATEANSGLSATVDVTVVAKVIDVTGVTLDKETADMKVGETLQLTATVAPEDATEKKLTWSVALAESRTKSIEDIATVSDAGLVTAVAAGKVVVTAKTVDGDFTASAEISITNVAVTGVTIDQTSVNVVGNEKFQLTATIEPENATIKNVTWSLEFNSNVRTNRGDINEMATIDPETGEITGKQRVDGWIDAVATTTDGGKTARVQISITYVAVTSITLTPSSVGAMDPGETQQMTASILPANATNQTITWSAIEDNNICRLQESQIARPASDFVTVDENGLVTAVEYYYNDHCNIKVKAEVADGFFDEVSVSVNPTLAEKITINHEGNLTDKTLSLGACSHIYTFSTTASPSNTTDQSVTWEITSGTGASIDSAGKITFSAASGTTVRVTATARDESKVTDYVDVTYAGCADPK